jgi:acetyl-CoA acetyltransferase
MSGPCAWRGEAAAVGVANTPFLKHGASGRGSMALTLDAILSASEDAGIDAHDIDGFVSYANDRSEGLAVGAALGVHEIRWSTMVWGGGGGALAAAFNAAAIAVATGQAGCVAVYRGISEIDVGRQSYSEGHISSLYSAHGVFTPAQICALRTQRMIEVDGVPASAMEALVAAAYHHARNNPDAAGRDRDLDHESYLDARPISDPLRLFDCSRENDAAGAVIVTTAERARDLRHPPAYVLSGVQGGARGWTESVENEDRYTSAGFHPALVERLWDEAGVKPNDVDVVQVYENFSGPAVASLIDLGLCPPGPEAGAFMRLENLVAPDGALPVNTAGGNIAEGFVHGIGLAVEAVRQIRGTSPNQVPNARRSLLLGGPMAPLVSATLFGSTPTP